MKYSMWSRDCGLIWFVRTSYSYINPQGFLAKLMFCYEVLVAYYYYDREMRYEFNNDEK